MAKHVNAIFADRSREFTKDVNHFFMMILNSTTERYSRHMGNSVEKVKAANQTEMGKCMAGLAQELNCKLDALQALA